MAGISCVRLFAAAFSPLVLGFSWNLTLPPARGEDQAPRLALIETDIAKTLNQQLANPIKFQDTSLSAAMAEIKRTYGLQIVIDRRALEAAGIDTETPVSLSIEGVTLRSALNLLLRELDLTWSIHNGALLITTREEAEISALHNRVYDVTDLCNHDGEDALMDVIAGTVAPDTWEQVGGPASIAFHDGDFVISQTDDVHEDLRNLLTALRKAKHVDEMPPVVFVESVDNSRIWKALSNGTLTVNFQDVSLSAAMADLELNHGIPIHLDERALEAAGIDTETPVSLTMEGLPLSATLDYLLRELDLVYSVQDEVLLITTQEEAEISCLKRRVYPVRDLLQTIDATLFRSAGYDIDPLMDSIFTTISPDSWDPSGGPGSLAAYEPLGVLVCAQTDDVHRQIQMLLAKLRDSRAERANDSESKKTGSNAGDELILRIYRPHVQPTVGGAIPTDPNTIVAVIVDLVEPKSWNALPGAYIRGLDGRIIVRHTQRTQKQIAELLNELGLLQQMEGVEVGGFGGGLQVGGGFF